MKNSFIHRVMLNQDPNDPDIERKSHYRPDKCEYFIFDSDSRMTVSFNNENSLNEYLKSQQALREAAIHSQKNIKEKKERKIKKKIVKSLFDNYNPLDNFDIEDFLK